MALTLTLDRVQDAEVDSSIFVGRIIRTAYYSGLPLPSGTPDTSALLQVLIAAGMPTKGSLFPGTTKYFLKRHIIRPTSNSTGIVIMVYEFYGLTTFTDSSTLSGVPTQLFPGDFTPLYVFGDIGSDGKKFSKLLTLQTQLPMRHYVASTTVTFEAGAGVRTGFKKVNNQTWYGRPKGYWLCSALEGATQDDGITYTYTVVFSTKDSEDWSQLGFMTDDTGQAVYVKPSDVATLRAKPYSYSQDTSVKYLNKVGMFALADFNAIFGLSL